MPFYKTHQVTESFFNYFLDQCTKKPIEGDNREHPMLPVEIHTGGNTDFMVRYYRRSGDSPIEELMDYYPCIVIQDFQPELDRSQLWGKDAIEGVIDEVRQLREKVTLPLALKYKFRVTIVTDRHKHIQSANDFFMQNFNFHKPGYFTFNKFETSEGFIGDIVPYRAEWGEVPRADNRFEYAFDFTLNTYLHAKFKDYYFNSTTGEFVGGNFEDMLTKIKFNLVNASTNNVKGLSKIFNLDKPTNPTGSPNVNYFENYINDKLGWGSIINTLHTKDNPFVIQDNVEFVLPIRNDGGIKREAPESIKNLVDNDTHTLRVSNLYDLYLMRLEFVLKTNLSDREGSINFDIGVGARFNHKYFRGSKDADKPVLVSIDLTFYQAEAFKQNGGKIVGILDGNAEIYNISLLPIKLHHGKNI